MDELLKGECQQCEGHYVFRKVLTGGETTCPHCQAPLVLTPKAEAAKPSAPSSANSKAQPEPVPAPRLHLKPLETPRKLGYPPAPPTPPLPPAPEITTTNSVKDVGTLTLSPTVEPLPPRKPMLGVVLLAGGLLMIAGVLFIPKLNPPTTSMAKGEKTHAPILVRGLESSAIVASTSQMSSVSSTSVPAALMESPPIKIVNPPVTNPPMATVTENLPIKKAVPSAGLPTFPPVVSKPRVPASVAYDLVILSSDLKKQPTLSSASGKKPRKRKNKPAAEPDPTSNLMLFVSGVVTNRSATPYTSVKIAFTLMNANSRVIETSYAHIDRLEGHAAWPFKAMVISKDAAKFRLLKIEGER